MIEPGLGPVQCPSCAAEIRGRHCAECGEMRADLRHDGLRQLGTELLQSLTHFDGRFLRSMRALVARPGHLTAEFLRGARRPYVTPLQIFAVANVFYFVIQTALGWNTMSAPLRVQMNNMPYRRFARPHVEEFAAREGLSIEALTTAFDGRVETFAKSLIIVMVPLLAVGVAIVCRSRARGFLASSVFALHFFAFVLWLQGLVFLPLGSVLSMGWFGALQWDHIDEILMVGLLGTLTIYEFLALRTAFGYAGAAALWRAVMLTLAFVAVSMVYRFVLFLVVLHTLPTGG